MSITPWQFIWNVQQDILTRVVTATCKRIPVLPLHTKAAEDSNALKCSRFSTAALALLVSLSASTGWGAEMNTSIMDDANTASKTESLPQTSAVGTVCITGSDMGALMSNDSSFFFGTTTLSGGTLVLDNAHTYHGKLSIEGGALTISAPSNSDSSQLTITHTPSEKMSTFNPETIPYRLLTLTYDSPTEIDIETLLNKLQKKN